MNIEEIRMYALSKPGVAESFPFGRDVLVFKVDSKMFLSMGLERKPVQFNAKCDPDKAIELRELYSCIVPGYHMNKKHWNTIIIDNTLSNKQLKELIDHSYQLVNTKSRKKA